MNTIERLWLECADPVEFADAYLGHVADLLGSLDRSEVAGFIAELEKARRGGGTVFIAGNGGSAATASHMANDLGVGTRADGDLGAVRAVALTDGVATMTATANDHGYGAVFVRQLEVHYRPGDRLVVISASGNSPNVVAAAEWVRERNGTVIGLLGFDGGRLRSLCDVVVHVKTAAGEYGPVEDVHVVVRHLVWGWLQRRTNKEHE